MRYDDPFLLQRWCWCAVLLLCSCVAIPVAQAQLVQQAVGGIAIDAEGVLAVPSAAEEQRLAEVRQQARVQAPADLRPWTDLRAVSLKQLEGQLAQFQAAQQPLPEAVRYLAGLQRVQFVLVYPEQGDVVLAGPAEGWRLDSLGHVVGSTSGRPVLLLEDLMVALRTRATDVLEPISCSIDPTPAGIQRLQALSRKLSGSVNNVAHALRQMETALGPQVISITGVPPTSHFARTLVAADFRMKRLAMGFEPAPVDAMPSFLALLQASRGRAEVSPRWWLAPHYLPLARDAAGLAWELRGQGVQCLTEQDHLDRQGQRIGTNQASAAAQRWAHTFTERYGDLCDQDSIFGQLRNAMDLAVVAALMDQERLLDQAGLTLPALTHQQPLLQYPVPKRVASQASFVKRRGDYLVSTSGGVQLLPWEVARQSEATSEVSTIREKFSAAGDRWYRQ